MDGTLSTEVRHMSCILLNQDHISWLVGLDARFPFVAETEVLQGSMKRESSRRAKCSMGLCARSSPGVSELRNTSGCQRWEDAGPSPAAHFRASSPPWLQEAAPGTETAPWAAGTLLAGQPRWPWPRLRGSGHHACQPPRAPGMCRLASVLLWTPLCQAPPSTGALWSALPSMGLAGEVSSWHTGPLTTREVGMKYN